MRRSTPTLVNTALGLVLAAGLSTPAMAELPDPVREMINAAIATGDADKVATVIDIAKSTNPEDAAEIDGLAKAFNDEQAAIAAQEAAAEEEAIRNAGFFENWSGQGELGAFRSTGNTSDTGLTAGIGLEKTGINWRHKINALADYQRTSGVTTREQFVLAYEANRKISDRLFAYGLAQYERDRFQGFDARYSVSGGLGYQVIDSDTMQLAVKAGPAYRRTELSGGGSTSNIAALAAADFDWQIADNIKFTQDATAFVQSGNSTYVSVTGLEAGLSDSLSARFSYQIEHDTQPPAGAVKTDTLTRFTLIYGF